MDSKNLFREKSLKRITSPEALNDYIKIANPGIWMLIVSIIIIMSCALVWSFFFNMEETISSYAYTEAGDTIILIAEAEIEELKNASDSKFLADGTSTLKANIDGVEYNILNIENTPICIDETYDAYYLHVLGLSVGDWAYKIHIDGNLDDGVSEVNIITNTFTPASMIFN